MNAVPAHRKALPARLLLAALPLALLFAGCDGGVIEPPLTEPAASVAALIAEDASFTRLDAALEQADLSGLLASGGPYTVFAPTDEAFYLLGTRTAGLLLDGAAPALLTEVLRAHVVDGLHTADDLRSLADEGGSLTTLDGVALDVSLDADGTIRVAGAPVEETDLEAGNGLVHALGGVVHHHLDTAERFALLPFADDFRAALANADLLGLLANGDITVLVAIDDGFARQPGGTTSIVGAEAGLRERVFRYHLIPGRHTLEALLADDDVASLEGATLDFYRDERGLPYVNDARVLAADLETTDGVLHVIEGPLLEHLTLGERVQLIPQISRVRSALSSLGLLSLLDGPGPLTFFAPVDGAFTALGPNVYNPLLSNQQGDLLPRFLRHHIATEAVTSDEFQQGASFPSLDDGNAINVTRGGLGIRIDEAPPGRYLDLRASNGVLHLMDGVLIPDVDVVDRMFLAGYTRFLDLVDLAGLEEELRTGGPYTIVPPRNLLAFYFEPQRECYAEDAVLSHVGEGITEYNPIGTGFADLAGGSVSMSGPAEEATATRSFGPLFEKTTPILDIELEATNGVVYGVEDHLSFVPDVRPLCD